MRTGVLNRTTLLTSSDLQCVLLLAHKSHRPEIDIQDYPIGSPV